jgi:hypothetical protein
MSRMIGRWIRCQHPVPAAAGDQTLGVIFVVSVRAYKIALVTLVFLLAFVTWRHWMQSRQMVWASFIDAQCRTTQESFIDESIDPGALALRLDFLMGYYEAHSKVLAGSRLESIVRRGYQQTLTHAVAAFRSMTTNDLGSDPRAWIERYEQ